MDNTNIVQYHGKMPFGTASPSTNHWDVEQSVPFETAIPST